MTLIFFQNELEKGLFYHSSCAGERLFDDCLQQLQLDFVYGLGRVLRLGWSNVLESQSGAALPPK